VSGEILMISADDYHADCCPAPSLSSGIAKLLIRRSPRHAHHAHPRLGGERADDPTRTMDNGSIIHKLMLGRGAGFAMIAADDYKTKRAQEARDEARAQGLVPVLAKTLEQLQAAADAALAQMRAHPDCQAFFDPGRSEAVITWQEHDIWLRCMVDRLPDDPTAPWFDIKATQLSAAPVDYQRAIIRDHAFQRSFYLRSARHVGYLPSAFLFVVVEQKPPHAVSVMTVAPSLAEIADREVERAVALWRSCIRSGVWPGYAMKTAYVDAPGWMTAAEQLDEPEEELA